MTRYQNILGTVGHTPVVRIQRLAPAHVNLWAKDRGYVPVDMTDDEMAIFRSTPYGQTV